MHPRGFIHNTQETLCVPCICFYFLAATSWCVNSFPPERVPPVSHCIAVLTHPHRLQVRAGKTALPWVVSEQLSRFFLFAAPLPTILLFDISFCASIPGCPWPHDSPASPSCQPPLLNSWLLSMEQNAFWYPSFLLVTESFSLFVNFLPLSVTSHSWSF